MSALVLRGIDKRFGAVQGLAKINLSAAAGSRTAIVGPSGSGKTTLLRIIAGFDAPDAGSVMLGGKLLADGAYALPAHERVIGYVPQEGALFPHLSVEANVGFGLASAAPSERAERVRELMDLVSLDRSLLARWPHELSGGQQQRVALARALAHKPSLMLLDEPFSALDTGLRASTRKAVARLLADAGITTILVTHDQGEALRFADQLAVMREARLVQVGDPVEIYRHPIDEITARFLGFAIILPARITDGLSHSQLGVIPVAGASRNGMAKIMLRPEQLRLSAATDSATGPLGCFGVVTDAEFGGPTCDLTLSIEAGVAEPVAHALLRVRYPSNQAPTLGSRIRIAVAGLVHVFDDTVAVRQDKLPDTIITA